MKLVSRQVEYKPLTTNNHTTAQEAYKQKKGVCQDQAHIMISAARSIGIPARYINENKLSQYSVMVIELGEPSAFWIIS